MTRAAEWFNEDPYSLYFLLRENQSPRRAFTTLLGESAAALREGKLLSEERDRDGALRALHLALASELHKALDLFVAVCRAGTLPQERHFAAVFNPKNTGLDAWLDSIRPDHPAEELRAIFPYATAAEHGLTGREAEAVDFVVERNARALRAALNHARHERRFLGPFRNRWSHTSAFQMFGTPAEPGGTTIPVLKVPTVGGPGEELGIIDRVLVSSPENDRALLRMVHEVMVLESAIVEARLNTLRNKNQPYLPRWVFKEAGEAIDPGVLETFEAALRKKDQTLPVVKFYPTTSVHDDTLQRAVEFYKHQMPHG